MANSVDQAIGYGVGGTGMAVYISTPENWVMILTVIVLLIRIIVDAPKAWGSIKRMWKKRKGFHH